MAHDSTLEPILQVVEPRVRLISERHLRQVLQFLEDAGRPQPPSPIAPFWVNRSDLVEADVLPWEMLGGNDAKFLLITDPDDRLISNLPQGEQLLRYWRVLFQAAIAQELELQARAGSLTIESCQEKLGRFGQHIEREIRYVLGSEELTLPDADALALYSVFARVYLDLTYFEKDRLDDYFPSLPHDGSIARMLEEGLDADSLFKKSRPVGAAAPPEELAPIPGVIRGADFHLTTPDLPPTTEAPEETSVRANEAERTGNHVRSAIIYEKLAAAASGDEQERWKTRAHAAQVKVVNALGDLFTWEHDTRHEWLEALSPVFQLASSGVWPRAARCLYELQRIPCDLSREVYAVDLPECIRTFGRRPIKRLLPHARPVLILMHLRKAQSQMLRCGLKPAMQLRLDRLFHYQILKLEESIRAELTPIIANCLTRAGLVPGSTVETVGRDKLIAELLDRICERGYLRLGDLRDAIARNQMKMADLASIGQFFLGDGLLCADSSLAEELDGVYRRGEIYLRSIQRFSALFFGTPLGRLFTIYIAIPFGGAFLALMFAEEIRHLGTKLANAINRAMPRTVLVENKAPAVPAGETTTAIPDRIDAHQIEWNEETKEIEWYPYGVVTSDDVEVDDGGNPIWLDSPARKAIAEQIFTSSSTSSSVGTHSHHKHTFLIEWPTIVGVGFFLLFMIHVPPFRQVVFRIASSIWWVVRGIFWDLPHSVWRSPALRGIRQSLVCRFLIRHFWSPSLLSLILFLFLFVLGVNPWFILKWGWAIWGALSIAYSTDWGWLIQDRIAEAISDWWRLVRSNLIPGLISTIIDWFRMLGNWFERRLYAVDEWFRFRGGDSRPSLAAKAALSLVWFPIAYITRFAFYLLIEPQINPVKHFPVVTVSHKVILPMVPQIADWVGLSPETVLVFVSGIPGIFGFVAWELKENWRLYKGNLSRRLKPVAIGSHGETMRGLLRPGFHSGTVPKLFRKLRQANRAKASRFHHDLDHVAEAIEHFAARELVDLLQRSSDWGNIALSVRETHLGCQRIAIEFAASGIGNDLFVIAFENVDGKIHATVVQTGWVDKLTALQQCTLVTALRGVLDMAAVDVVECTPRQEIPTPTGPGFQDLTRYMTWPEWEERWKLLAPARGELETHPK